MKSTTERIQGIIAVLTNNSLNAHATDISVSINRDDERFVVNVKDNGAGMDGKTLEKVRQMLNQPHRYELEDYYSGLAGNSITATGLNIVGMLIDEAVVESVEGQGTTITVTRYNKAT
ncbi:MAG: sensor histidine kinase [Clostridiales bacterium]|nr:sensor histidine kinase [Clostridiales bacterium]